MAATDDRTFAGSIPEIYDRYLAPLIFDSYALDLASEFSDLSVDAVDHRSKASSPHDPAIAYCQGTPLRSEIETRDASRLREATERAAEALANRFGRRHIDGRIRAFVITAIR